MHECEIKLIVEINIAIGDNVVDQTVQCVRIYGCRVCVGWFFDVTMHTVSEVHLSALIWLFNLCGLVV